MCHVSRRTHSFRSAVLQSPRACVRPSSAAQIGGGVPAVRSARTILTCEELSLAAAPDRRAHLRSSTVYRTVEAVRGFGDHHHRHDFREGRARYEQIPRRITITDQPAQRPGDRVSVRGDRAACSARSPALRLTSWSTTGSSSTRCRSTTKPNADAAPDGCRRRGVRGVVTVPLMPLQWLAVALKRPLRRRIPVFYHRRFLCRLLGIRVRRHRRTGRSRVRC